MSLKLSQLVSAAPALLRLSAQPVKARIAFHLSKVMRLVEPELKAYDEARIKLLKELGKPKADHPEQYEFLDGNAEKFVMELNELLAQEVALEFKPLPFADIEQLEISASDVIALDWLIANAEGEVK